MGKNISERQCVVDGRPIHFCGGRDDFLRGRTVENGNLGSVCDGVDTNVGAVCSFCMDFYDRVFDVVDGEFPGNSPNSIRKIVRERLGDMDLLMQVRKEKARKEVLSILREGGGILFKTQILKLKDFFLKGVSIFDYDDDGLCGENILPLKVALGCFLDVERTDSFLKALSFSLNRLFEARDEIEVIDAGCGPVPLFGVISALKSDRVKKVTCLEVNPNSAKMAEQIVSNLGLSDIINVVNCDATKYSHYGTKKPDLLISETMFSGLVNEPLVHVLNNLVPQISEEAEIIPRKVSVNAGLIRADYVGSRLTEFELDPVPVFNYVAGDGCQCIDFAFSFKGLSVGKYQLVLSTDIDLCEGAYFYSGVHSEVTRPHRVGPVFSVGNGDGEVVVSYKPGDDCSDVKVSVI